MKEIKKCSWCKEIKPVTEFYIHSRGTGWSAWCKYCYLEHSQEDTQKKLRNERNKKFRESSNGKEYMRAYLKKYQPEYQKKEKWKNYNRERCQLPEHKVYMANYQSWWMKTPKGKAHAARSHSKRRMLESEIVCDLTAEQWEEIKSKQNCQCNICGKIESLHRDHIIPLSKGGAFTKGNVQGLCKSCNSKKGNKILSLSGGEKCAGSSLL